jgi:hypothetical protein
MSRRNLLQLSHDNRPVERSKDERIAIEFADGTQSKAQIASDGEGVFQSVKRNLTEAFAIAALYGD